jgi:hypothetical protein
MSYSILSSNVVLGSDSTPSYSFVTNAGGTLQLECIDSGVTDPQLEVDGSVKCDTVYFTNPTRSRAVASDQFGKLVESTVELDTLQGFDSRITVVEGQTSHLGDLIDVVDGNTTVFGNGITANADLHVEGSINCTANLTTDGAVYATNTTGDGPALSVSQTGTTSLVETKHGGGNVALKQWTDGSMVLGPTTNNTINTLSQTPFAATLGVYGNILATDWFTGNVDAANVVTEALHASAFDLSGNMQATGVNASGITITGDLYAVNGRFSGDVFIAASDRRLKTDIQVIENASETIRQIHGYTYRWRDDIAGLPLHGEDCGIIAQEAAATSLGSHLIRPAPFDHTLEGESISGERYMTVRYDRLHALEIQCLHELLDRLDKQDATIRELQEKLKSP